MKRLYIFSVVCVLLVLSACTMSDDTIMSDIDNEIQNTTETYASFGLNLNGGGNSTKSSSTVDKDPEAPAYGEQNVATCFLAIFNADTKQLITSYYYGEKGGDIIPEKGDDTAYSLGQHLTFKVKETNGVKAGLIFVAIANVNPSSMESSSLKTFQSCTTYDALMKAQIIENPTVLLKVGEKRISSADYETSSSLLDPESFLTTVTIPLTQRSASVELATFSVKNRNTAGATTDLTSNVSDVFVNLENVSLYTKVEGVDNSAIEEAVYDSVEFKNGKQASRLYTYANTSTDKTMLTISYKLNGEQKYAKYTIKTPAAKGGYTEEVRANTLYKLNVTIINEVVNVTVKCYTLDWTKNEINVDL